MRWKSLCAAAALMATAACGTPTASGTPSSPSTTPAVTETPTGRSTPSAACNHGAPIYMVQPYAPAAALTAAYRPIIASLSKSLGCQVRFEVASSIKAEISAATHGHVAFAEFAGLGSGFALAGTHPAIEVAATYESDFNGTPAAFISALYADPRYGEIDLAGLAGKRVAFTTPGSLSGDFFPRAALTEAGAMSKVTRTYSGSHLQALRDLTCPPRPHLRHFACMKVNYASLNSRVMGPAAKSHEWDPGKYTQIWHSDPIPYTAIGLSTALSEDLRKDLRAALLDVPAGNIRYVAQLIQFEAPITGKGLVAIGSGNYCQSSNLDLCDVIKTLKLTPAQVRPLDGEGL